MKLGLVSWNLDTSHGIGLCGLSMMGFLQWVKSRDRPVDRDDAPDLRAVPGRNLDVQEVTSEADFLAMRDEWDELLSRSDNDILFLTHEWLGCWWKHFGRPWSKRGRAELFVLGVRRAGRLCGVAPLFLMKDRYLGYPVTIAGFLGQGMSDYSDLIVRKGEDRDEVLGSIVRHLAARSGCWDVMDLRNFLGESGNLPVFRKYLDHMGWDHRLDPESFCRFVQIRGDWDSYYRSCYSGDHRKNHRKEWKRLVSAVGGNVRFIESTEDSEGLIEQLAEIETHHPQAGSGRPGFLRTDPFRGFFGDLLPAAAQRGWLNVVLMECDGFPAAFTLSFRYNMRFYLYLTSYNEEFQKYGIGRLTCFRMMERYWRSGEGEIDFLRGEEEYKEKWAPEGRQNLRILASHATPRSRAARWLWGKCLPSVERRMPRVHRVLVASNEVGWNEVLKRISRRLGSRGKERDSIPQTGP